ncbi:MAG: ankyrin repeat domain-containing protein [Planctomycetes bacterium]|nr:ankyrin repeat domain-containing protein [Planctomycetota bacterium]
MAQQFWQQVKAAIREGNPDKVARLIGDDESKLTMSTVFGPWLHLAAKYGQLSVAKRLVAMGVDVNARGGVSNGTALAEASSEGHVDIVEYLTSCGAVLDVSEVQNNPLIGAISGGHWQVAEVLLRHGLDPNVTYVLDSGKRRNALSYARRRGQTEIAELLVAAGCTVPAATLAEANREAHRKLSSVMAEQFGEVFELRLPDMFPVDDESHISLRVIRPSDKHHRRSTSRMSCEDL